MHEEVLVPHARKIFPRLARFKSFYLVGGTALALQIGHRISIDFDMFSPSRLPVRLLQDAKRILKGHEIVVTYRSPEQLNLTVDEVKMTFFSYPYPVVDPYITYEKVPLATILEISAMKAHAIGRRTAYKDYVDWYFLLKNKYISIQDVIDFSQKKFGSDFNSRLFLGQLASLIDVSTQEINFFGKRVSRNAIEKFLEREVDRYIQSLDT